VLLLLGIGFVAGLVTAISPCVLPVLPLVLGGGATGGRRKPYAIVAGLVTTFTLFTLFATALLDAVGLPKDFLRNLSLVLLLLLAAGLLFPQVGYLLERPFYRFTRRRQTDDLGGGFLLGASLGLVFVPCAGPVLAAVTVKAAENEVSPRVFALMLAYALGAALPMLAIAVGGQRASERTRFLRAHAQGLRRAAGLVFAVVALAIALDLDRPLQTALPGYTASLQRVFEQNSYSKDRLADLRGGRAPAQSSSETAALKDYGQAPDFIGISHWLNTPGDKGLTMSDLRGRVVLVDFWTYSCINCLRTLPYLNAWYRTYHSKGLVIVGVHTPEFAFEHELSNVRKATRQLAVKYPVALDNGYDTWNAYGNQYWPAEYFVDRRGHVRYTHFGEGAYDTKERLIRKLLGERSDAMPVASRLTDQTPQDALTPESYLGYSRVDRLVGDRLVPNRFAPYTLPPALQLHQLAYAGTWKVESERIVAGLSARLRLRFHARKVFLVLGGKGRVQVYFDGKHRGSVAVTQDRLYTLLRLPRARTGLLDLWFTPGVEAYAFTFG
jgi:cytochrome c biogenesis protein CcdA/thiol-disulfide isomerase/thioredoxin